MKRYTIVARETAQAAGLERLKHLEEQLGAQPVNGGQHRALRAAIRTEADAYRKSLDTEQAASRKPILGSRRRIHSRGRTAARN